MNDELKKRLLGSLVQVALDAYWVGKTPDTPKLLKSLYNLCLNVEKLPNLPGEDNSDNEDKLKYWIQNIDNLSY